jgi:hypothetical protein
MTMEPMEVCPFLSPLDRMDSFVDIVLSII